MNLIFAAIGSVSKSMMSIGQFWYHIYSERLLPKIIALNDALV
jgi:hypothetical protein